MESENFRASTNQRSGYGTLSVSSCLFMACLFTLAGVKPAQAGGPPLSDVIPSAGHWAATNDTSGTNTMFTSSFPSADEEVTLARSLKKALHAALSPTEADIDPWREPVDFFLKPDRTWTPDFNDETNRSRERGKELYKEALDLAENAIKSDVELLAVRHAEKNPLLSWTTEEFNLLGLVTLPPLLGNYQFDDHAWLDHSWSPGNPLAIRLGWTPLDPEGMKLEMRPLKPFADSGEFFSSLVIGGELSEDENLLQAAWDYRGIHFYGAMIDAGEEGRREVLEAQYAMGEDETFSTQFSAERDHGSAHDNRLMFIYSFRF
ncbi:MAG: hypothetical protein HQL52_00065 [Magnetococcales bacterium]|nr:hypothetical protein [Magnetococcales bacterium]